MSLYKKLYMSLFKGLYMSLSCHWIWKYQTDTMSPIDQFNVDFCHVVYVWMYVYIYINSIKYTIKMIAKNLCDVWY